MGSLKAAIGVIIIALLVLISCISKAGEETIGSTRVKVRMGSVGDDAVLKETLESELKDLEKEKKRIVGYESDIDNIKLEIPALVEQQNQKMQEIEQQRKTVNLFGNKLATISNY